MYLSQRQGALITMGIQLAGMVVSVLAVLSISNNTANTINLAPGVGITLAYAAAMAAYWFGWNTARYVMVVLVSAAIGMTTPLNQGFSVAVLMPVAVALVMTNSLWVVGSAVVTMGLVLARSGGGGGSYTNPQGLVFFVAIVATVVIARIVTDGAQRAAEERARLVEEARSRAEIQAQELAESNQRQEAQLEQQQRLLDLIATLETPAVQIAEGVLFAPIVGALDSRRASQLTMRLLERTHEQRTNAVILDIAGLSVVDTNVARSLLDTAQALRLLGCHVYISGVSASVASALVHLGVDLQSIITVQSPQDALARYSEQRRAKAASGAPTRLL
jgi:anti-anti-sigma regulatory factor